MINIQNQLHFEQTRIRYDQSTNVYAKLCEQFDIIHNIIFYI